MQTSADVFDQRVEQWVAEQSQPWSKLKHRQVEVNLAKHIGPGSLRVLDAGGGIGSDSIPLAVQGHQVDLVDYSNEMLAEAARQAQQANVAEQVKTHAGSVQDLTQIFSEPQFDLALCHNVIQYVADVPALYRSLAACLHSGGLLSLICINRYSAVYRTALPQGNLKDALSQIDKRDFPGILFDATLTYWTAEEASQMLEEAGFEVEKDYGIHCISAYWGTNELKAMPANMEGLERLELALTDRYPYKLLARYFHIIARKA
jgi:S-adenosylmethionine-dependent methyltransferase